MATRKTTKAPELAAPYGVTRPATIVYSWVTIRPSKRSKKPVRVECIWSLVGGNGEHMCSSFPEGYRDKSAAKAAVEAVTSALFGRASSEGLQLPREKGPGPRPKDDEVTP